MLNQLHYFKNVYFFTDLAITAFLIHFNVFYHLYISMPNKYDKNNRMKAIVVT